jgi:hypothetical protein
VASSISNSVQCLYTLKFFTRLMSMVTSPPFILFIFSFIQTSLTAASMYLLADNSVSDLSQYRPYLSHHNTIATKSQQTWTLAERLFISTVVISVLLSLVFFYRRASQSCTSKASGCQTIAKDQSLFNMPPVRGPMNTKGLKTERTHEENQERFVDKHPRFAYLVY